ncbi:hypothetical protein [Nocardioides sp. B-3]|uniref:hypothetical protein n=1 Tax=Nocardioides sp. B-3 TaxID=2895565 RepID=UPI00215257DF|nr:hypothetical protein [Nocardioides sp. B-3]UUZ59916.1 hypothetical protein LP418_02395 [Nocardioides sp. B-3]
MLELTAEQLRALRSEIRAVIERYRVVGVGDPSARPVALHHVAYPRDLRLDR